MTETLTNCGFSENLIQDNEDKFSNNNKFTASYFPIFLENND